MYYAKHDFECSMLGKFKKNAPIEDCDRAKVLFRLGYLEKNEKPTEYKTKVVQQKPAKYNKKTAKKKSKK